MNLKSRTVSTGICTVFTLLLTAVPGQAGILFTYNGFSSTSGLTLVGNSAVVTTADGPVVRVSPGSTGQAGAVYSTVAVPLGGGATFSTQFTFRFTNPGGIDPADGITFVLSNNTTGLGSSGGGLGYQSAQGNSVAIEFDTYNNGGGDGNSSNHVAVDVNGVLSNTGLVNVYGISNCELGGTYLQAGCMSNGHLWTVTITYDGANLNVVLKDSAMGTSFAALTNYAINIAQILGQNTAFVGFTSATGSGFENHDVTYWAFSNSSTLTGGTASVPALSGWAMGGLTMMLATAGWMMLRRSASDQPGRPS